MKKPDSRHSSADKSYRNKSQQYIETRDDTHLAQHRTAQLRNRHGLAIYNQSNTFQREQPVFWTLPKIKLQDVNYRHTIREPAHYPGKHLDPMCLPLENQPHMATNPHDESIKISPIDPRTSGSFKSSTPSNKENVNYLGERLLSPTKSTMTNEELYAVIHKSKKKLNIKDPIERADSPALSSISLSPVSSENSLIFKGTQKYPETGYLIDAKSRNSYSSSTDKYASHLPGSRFYTGPTIESTCADRLGPTPQTSRMDFKKLLLRHSVKLNTINPQQKTHKLSAVEQLKLSKEKALPIPQSSSTNQINILDLTGSPKIYHNRKNIKPTPQPASPGRTSALIKEHKSTPKILLSPKSQWRFSSPRSDVLSSPILEVNNEDENSNSSGDKAPSPEGANSKTVPIVTNQHFGARRNLIPISEHDQCASGTRDQGVFPLHAEPIKLPGRSRTEYLQAKRAEFFNSPTPEPSPPKFTSFKKSPTAPNTSEAPRTSPERGKISPTTLETAL
ncbi:hypothetical protein EVAR_33622_1 [Eumeta japonica]|uniref:Uncharacterized protein n=1 Tax=Eumeta variegata TaxID=151549 RepID=A0A4C1WCR0_EUMVA|nr:hypothetical protein EVAR_33622_1 [Eumeta japonica]